jgi:hypothetical protein
MKEDNKNIKRKIENLNFAALEEKFSGLFFIL